MVFNILDFLTNPKIDVYDSLQKTDLQALANHLNLQLKSSLSKDEIKVRVTEKLVAEKVFESSNAKKLAELEKKFKQNVVDNKMRKKQLAEEERELKEKFARDKRELEANVLTQQETVKKATAVLQVYLESSPARSKPSGSVQPKSKIKSQKTTKP